MYEVLFKSKHSNEPFQHSTLHDLMAMLDIITIFFPVSSIFKSRKGLSVCEKWSKLRNNRKLCVLIKTRIFFYSLDIHGVTWNKVYTDCVYSCMMHSLVAFFQVLSIVKSSGMMRIEMKI